MIAINNRLVQIKETSCCDIIENIPEGWDLMSLLSYKAARLQHEGLESGEAPEDAAIVGVG